MRPISRTTSIRPRFREKDAVCVKASDGSVNSRAHRVQGTGWGKVWETLRVVRGSLPMLDVHQNERTETKIDSFEAPARKDHVRASNKGHVPLGCLQYGPIVAAHKRRRKTGLVIPDQRGSSIRCAFAYFR